MIIKMLRRLILKWSDFKNVCCIFFIFRLPNGLLKRIILCIKLVAAVKKRPRMLMDLTTDILNGLGS